MVWALVAFLVGIAYGWLSPGRQDKGRLFKNGLMIGVVLAIVFAVIGLLTNTSPLGIGGLGGALELIVVVVVVTLLFILGVWIGDLIEGGTTRRRTV